MKLAYVQAEGFRGFRNCTRVDLPPGFAVIVGPNGSGKSTVCDAVEFALTGSIRGASDHSERGESIEDYVWWRRPDGAERAAGRHVELGLVLDDGGTIRVRRTPRELVVEPRTSLVGLFVEEGTVLEDPLAQLCQTAILRDEDITRLSVDLKERPRFAFVRDALGTSDFEGFQRRAADVSKYLGKYSEDVEAECNKYRARIAALTSRLSEERAMAGRAADVVKAEGVLRESVESAAGGTGELVQLAERHLVSGRRRDEELGRLYVEAKRVVSGLMGVETEEYAAAVEEAELRVREAEAAAEGASEELGRRERELEGPQAKAPRAVLRAQLVESGAELGLEAGTCPLCGAAHGEEDFVARLEAVQRELAGQSARVGELSRKRRAAIQRVADARAWVEGGRRELGELRARAGAAGVAFEGLVAEVKNFGGVVRTAPVEVVGALAVEIERRQREVGEVEAALDVLAASRAARQIVEREREVLSVKEELARSEGLLSRVAKGMAYVDEAMRTMRRIQGDSVDEQLAAISPLFVELYERLRPHVDWRRVRYNLRGDVRRMLSLDVGKGLNPDYA